uniref:Uncharacterized protein n=1 Tax=Amphimedon queenslandica TaxID=400682 RepID=A0A1X7SNA4_AMPQE
MITNRARSNFLLCSIITQPFVKDTTTAFYSIGNRLCSDIMLFINKATITFCFKPSPFLFQ